MDRVYGERYELGELIATGRGELWRATDKVNHQTVAIRIGASVDQRVAQILSTLKHPAIERILDFGADYVVVEDIGASPFNPVNYSTSLVLRAFAELADGLRLVHEDGGAHGDIQMTDLISSSDGTVVLTGFGLAAKADDLYRLASVAAQCLPGTSVAQRATSFVTFAEFAAAAREEAAEPMRTASPELSAPPPSQPVPPPMSVPAPPGPSPVMAPAPMAPPPPAPPRPAPSPVAQAPMATPAAPPMADEWAARAPGGAMPPAGMGSLPPVRVQPAPRQASSGDFELISANFALSVGYPKRVAKGRASAFLVQIHVPKDQAQAAQRLVNLLGDNVSSQAGEGRLPLGRDVTITLASPDIEFSAPKQWHVSPSGIDAAFYGRPADHAKAGSHVGILSISDANAGSELVSMPFTVTIADFGLGKMSRPTIRGVLTGALVVVSAAAIGYSVLNHLQEIMGLVTGTVGAAVSAVVTVRTTALYTRKAAGNTKTVPIV